MQVRLPGAAAPQTGLAHPRGGLAAHSHNKALTCFLLRQESPESSQHGKQQDALPPREQPSLGSCTERGCCSAADGSMLLRPPDFPMMFWCTNPYKTLTQMTISKQRNDIPRKSDATEAGAGCRPAQSVKSGAVWTQEEEEGKTLQRQPGGAAGHISSFRTSAPVAVQSSLSSSAGSAPTAQPCSDQRSSTSPLLFLVKAPFKCFPLRDLFSPQLICIHFEKL